MGTDEENKFGMGMVRRGTVISMPDGVPEPCSGGTHIGMTVVSIHIPGLQHPVHVFFVPGAPHMVGNSVIPTFL